MKFARMRKRTETEQAAEARNDDLEEKAALALADSQKKTAPSAGAFTQALVQYMHEAPGCYNQAL